MSLPEPLKDLFSHVDANKTKYFENLKEAVAIQSVSAWEKNRDDVIKMGKWLGEKFEALGAKIEYIDVGEQTLLDGGKIPLPPVVIGEFEKDPSKKTVLVYGHYDVQPALIEDGWDSDPFVLIEKNGKYFGRGSTDDKGPVLGWMHVIEAFQEIGTGVPVNFKFIFEGMEESGSEGLEGVLLKLKDTFLSDIDYVCVSDNYWLGNEKPCLTYGLRGICYYQVSVECAAKDLHSGVFGGVVHEALPDLIYLLNTLTDNEGKILIPNIYREVKEITPEELEIYKNIDFDVCAMKCSIGCDVLPFKEDKVEILMHRWRHPSCSVHGIEGAFSESGAKTVIPRKVNGKFSIRIVPDQKIEDVHKYVADHFAEQWKKRGSPNKMEVVPLSGGKFWFEDPDHPNYVAGKRATQHVYGVEPDLTREGGSIPIVIDIKEAVGNKSVVLLPMGASDDGAHSQNEKIDVRNYIEGTKLLGAYLYEVSQIETTV